MIDQADQSLYVAKRGGRDRLVSWAEVADSQEDLSKAQAERRSSRRAKEQNQTPTTPATNAQRPEAEDEVVLSAQAVKALVSALEFRDPATGAHCARVASMSLLLGQGLMSDRELRLLETAALLHDIGKIGVPDSILLKPQRLTDPEWEVMHRQERIGVEIVRTAFSSNRLAEIIRTHSAPYQSDDEFSGMPTGEEIPLPARIISVCNAFDAMTSDRVYRKGMSVEAAITELRRCADKQFDSMLVERLIQIVSGHDAHVQLPKRSRQQSIFQIGQQIERIAEALDAFDLDGISALSERLVDTATSIGAGDIASAAKELFEATKCDQEVEQILRLTKTLMNVWQESQAAEHATVLVP